MSPDFVGRKKPSSFFAVDKSGERKSRSHHGIGDKVGCKSEKFWERPEKGGSNLCAIAVAVI